MKLGLIIMREKNSKKMDSKSFITLVPGVSRISLPRSVISVSGRLAGE
jgi:hypothetical protein